MNANRILNTLQAINRKLQLKQYCSPEQLRVLRKARAKWNKRLQQFINPQAPARPLPSKPSQQLTLSI